MHPHVRARSDELELRIYGHCAFSSCSYVPRFVVESAGSSSTFFTSLLAAAIEEEGITVARRPSGLGKLELLYRFEKRQERHSPIRTHTRMSRVNYQLSLVYEVCRPMT